jgi:hypothetical protein
MISRCAGGGQRRGVALNDDFSAVGHADLGTRECTNTDVLSDVANYTLNPLLKLRCAN